MDNMLESRGRDLATLKLKKKFGSFFTLLKESFCEALHTTITGVLKFGAYRIQK